LIINPNKNINEDLLYWVANYINYKASELFDKSTKNTIEDIITIKDNISNSKNINELTTNVTVPINQGLASLKKVLYGTIKFYNFTIDYTTDIKNINDRLLNDFKESLTGTDNTKKNEVDVTIELLNFIENSTKHNFNIVYKGMRVKKPKKKIRDAMDSEEFKKFNNSLSDYEYKDEITKARDIIIVRLILLCGLKPKEIVELKLSADDGEFMYKGNELYIDMKNRKHIGKQEVFYLPRKHFIRQLNKYAELKEYNKDNFLFYDLDNKDKQLKVSYIEQLVKNLLLHSNIKRRESDSEMLRTSLAVYLYNNREKGSQIVLNTIQKILGFNRLIAVKEMIGFHDEELSTVTNIFEEIL